MSTTGLFRLLTLASGNTVCFAPNAARNFGGVEKMNKLAKMLNDAYERGFIEGMNKGIDTGIQYNNDIYQCILNDPDIMGKDVFGQKRMLKIHMAAEAMSEEYTPCMYGVTDPEADVWQEKLDAKLKKVWGELFVPFAKRYTHLVEVSYEGRKRK